MDALRPLRRLLSDTAGQTVALVFAALSFVGANWIARIPALQERLALSEGELGLGLLGMPLGAIGAMLLVGRFVSRFGAGRVTLWTTYLVCLTAAAPALAASFGTFFLAMVLIGAGSGAMDVAMNAVAAGVEDRLERPIMAACHGFYSIGGMFGAGMGALMAALGLPLSVHLVLAGLVMAGWVAARRKTLLSEHAASVPLGPIAPEDIPAPAAPPTFVLPRGPLLGLAFMAFIILIGEGAMADWSAVYLRGTLGVSAGLAGLGYAAFSLTMAIGRLLGDSIVERVGAAAVVRGGAILAAGGLALALGIQAAGVVLVGFACVGLGYAGVVPILFRAAAHAPGVSAGNGLASVASAGYLGLLIGPPLIGFTATVLGLDGALGIVVVLTAFVALTAPWALRVAVPPRILGSRPGRADGRASV